MCATKVISNTRIVEGYTPLHGRPMSGTHIMWLECPEVASKAKPGQFVMVYCASHNLPRPFSIHRVVGDKMAILYQVLEGGATEWLRERVAGDILEIPIPRPLGNGFSINPRSKNILLIAGGIGFAPLVFLAEEALKVGCDVTMIYGSANNARCEKKLALPAGMELVSVTEDGSVGRKGFATDLIPEFAAKTDQVFACGPMAMYRDMAQRKNELGLEGKSVQVSLEVRMGCGHGVCYSCTVRSKNGLKQVCQDGPVFELDDIIDFRTL